MSAFRAVGGYDETFSHNEDAELDVRLRRAGYRIWMTPDPVYTYYPRRTVRALARQYFWFGHGRARTVLRHREANLRQLAVAPVVPALLVAGLVPRSRLARSPMVLWLVAVLAASHATARTARPAEQAQVALAVGVMHGAWSAGFCSHLLRTCVSGLGLRARRDARAR
jgi:succinoglycan biosynthesis protein ExoA